MAGSGRRIESTSPEDESVELSAARRRRHHYFPGQILKNEPLSAETKKIFRDATTGSLLDKRSNQFDLEHRLYDEAVIEKYNDYLARNGLTSQQLIPDQARAFLKEILESKDPRIRNFNMKILLREIMKRGPLRPRGNE